MISVKTQNRKGGNPQWKENLGYGAIFKDQTSFIVLDAYEGQGVSYKQRKEPEIRIQSKGKLIFQGTFDELEKKLELSL